MSPQLKGKQNIDVGKNTDPAGLKAKAMKLPITSHTTANF